MDEQIVRAVGADVYNGVITGDIACTLNANTGGGASHADPTVIAITAWGGKPNEQDGHLTGVSPTIRSNAAETQPSVCYRIGAFMGGQGVKARSIAHHEDGTTGENEYKYVIRRLTPIECARLQGFPDWWCDGANGSDSAQYKMWGNGIALPCAEFVLRRIVDAYRAEKE